MAIIWRQMKFEYVGTYHHWDNFNLGFDNFHTKIGVNSLYTRRNFEEEQHMATSALISLCFALLKNIKINKMWSQRQLKKEKEKNPKHIASLCTSPEHLENSENFTVGPRLVFNKRNNESIMFLWIHIGNTWNRALVTSDLKVIAPNKIMKIQVPSKCLYLC